MNTLHVDDFVVLGRTVPEESRRYGQRICMAGYSPENNQFLRVYPLMVPVGVNADANDFKARHQYAIDLRRNEQDNRFESWRLKDEKHPTSTPWDRARELKKEEIIGWLRKHTVESIRALNDCRMSLGVLYLPADRWEGFTVPRDAPGETEEHRTLFEDLAKEPKIDASRVRHAPYIKFEDAAGPHRLQVREWGAYLLLVQDKYADQPEVLWNAAGYKCGRDIFVVVGNMNNHRSNWLIIKTFQPDPPKPGRDLFGSLGSEAGEASEG